MSTVGDILSTVGVFSTVGDTLSTVGVFSTMGDIMSTMGDYLEYRGGYSVPWGYHDALGGVQYREEKIFCYLSTPLY